MFAEGFAYQSIFGFGPNANADTKKVLKISQTSPETLKKLDQHVDEHKIGEKRNVASFNYACTVRGGTRDLQSSSVKVVLKSSADIFDRCDPSSFRNKKVSHMKSNLLKLSGMQK